jgi:putative FmdB family regulatory protein
MMPVYRFKCNECGEVFDQKLSFDEADKKLRCPQGHDQVQRVFFAPTIVFKGSGFYVTDHRGKPSTGD